MSYSKLFTVVQDVCVGKVRVGQAISNNLALRDAYNLRHGIGIGGANVSVGGRYSPQDVGKHDDVVISRGVIHCDVDASSVVPVLLPRMAGPVFAPFSFLRLGPGAWRVFFAVPQVFAATASIKASGTSDRKAVVFRTADPNYGPGVIVRTWEKAGSWTPTDLSFSLQIWATF